jgi:hypothetical protein
MYRVWDDTELGSQRAVENVSHTQSHMMLPVPNTRHEKEHIPSYTCVMYTPTNEIYNTIATNFHIPFITIFFSKDATEKKYSYQIT